MDNLTHDEIELGLTSEFAAAVEGERERLEAERAKAAQRLTEAQAALSVATGRHQALERLLADDPQERGHAAEFIEGAQRERERLDDLLAAAEQKVAEAQAERDRLATQISDLSRLLSDEPGDLDAPDAPRADAGAVLEVLFDRGKPMHYRDIYAALADVGFKVGGADPASTLLTRFYNDARLERVARGTYQVREDYDCIWWDTHPSEAELLTDFWDVLPSSAEPLHYAEIADRLFDDSDVRDVYEDYDGSTQDALEDFVERVHFLIGKHLSQYGARSDFRRAGPVGYGTYARA